MRSRSLLLFYLFQCCCLLFVDSFNVPPPSRARQLQRPGSQLSSTGNFFDDFMDFLNPNNNSNDAEDEMAAGEFNVITIPVKALKPGGLRLFLMFYLLGIQNSPDKSTWRADQPTTEEYVVDFWYHDNSAVLSVTLSEEKKGVIINRVGSRPSTGYMIQESLVVQGLLDELETMANDPEVAAENRLLIPATEQTIEMARDALAFG
jgi:hypothetical protein